MKKLNNSNMPVEDQENRLPEAKGTGVKNVPAQKTNKPKVKVEAKSDESEKNKRKKAYSVGKSIAVGVGSAVGSFLGGLGRRY